MDLHEVMQQVGDELRALNAKLAAGEGDDETRQRAAELEDTIKNTRRPSRWVDPNHASREYVAELAKGHTAARVAEPRRYGSGGHNATGVGFLREVKSARLGDPSAYGRLTSGKAWVEGTDTAGGFLVGPEQLPGYIEARRAASPLRERCSTFDVRSNEVWVVTEDGSVQVAHTAEAATKLDTTGSVAQKISTVHKVAGTSHLSDELLDDTNDAAGDLVARQFAQQIGIAIDTAILSGTGTGQPTGIRNTTGVTHTAVGGQGGNDLYDSILRALSRLSQRFYSADTVVIHPRDAVKFSLAKDSTGQYLFPGGIEGQLPDGVQLVLDANVPATLGAGGNESVMIVGNFRAGGFFFQRQPLTIEASQHAAWATDETVFRAVERYGFAVVVPGAFEVLTGITP